MRRKGDAEKNRFLAFYCACSRREAVTRPATFSGLIIPQSHAHGHSPRQWNRWSGYRCEQLRQGTAQRLRPELRVRVRHLKAKGVLRNATVKHFITRSDP